MKLFSNWRQPAKISLKSADFVTKSSNASITSVKLNDEFLKMLSAERAPEDDIKTVKPLKSSEAVVQLFEKPVTVTFDPDEIGENLGNFIDKVNLQLNWVSGNKPLIEQAISNSLLSFKNSDWLQPNESPMTKEEFLNRINLVSADFFDDASLELCFNDGDIFGGHYIILPITADKNIETPTIEG